MDSISPQDIDKIRQNGFRPQAVGCIISNKQILFVYKKKYNLWQLPQGGIDNKETIEEATIREMTEELGANFTKLFKPKKVIGEDELIFPERNQGSRKLRTDKGRNIFMLGKKYFFVELSPLTISKSNCPNLDITQTEFNDHRWLDYQEALRLTKKIYQKGKQRTTLRALHALHDQNIL